MQTCLKSVKEIENSSADNQTKENILLSDLKTLKYFNCPFFGQKRAKDIENGSAVYQTKENICSMDCKTF